MNIKNKDRLQRVRYSNKYKDFYWYEKNDIFTLTLSAKESIIKS